MYMNALPASSLVNHIYAMSEKAQREHWFPCKLELLVSDPSCGGWEENPGPA